MPDPSAADPADWEDPSAADPADWEDPSAADPADRVGSVGG
ncbi:MAG: calreticulin family protein [Myxococcota bacterium]|nr:calreticulin family protein [Myxococcota bacterium]